LIKDRITKSILLRKKQTKEKITMMTAYDYPFGYILDKAGIDIILIGDSLGMTVQGMENTLSVTVDEIIYHTKMVVRAVINTGLNLDFPERIIASFKLYPLSRIKFM